MTNRHKGVVTNGELVAEAGRTFARDNLISCCILSESFYAFSGICKKTEPKAKSSQGYGFS